VEEDDRDIYQDTEYFPEESMKYESVRQSLRRKLNKKSPKYTAGMLTINNAMFIALKKNKHVKTRHCTSMSSEERISDPVGRICGSNIALPQYCSLFPGKCSPVNVQMYM
jgi:hypothetical protein